jgi:PAS domain S-box-containing protein
VQDGLNGRVPTTTGSGFTLATFSLRVEQDVVSLRRRVRAAGDRYGVPEHRLRGLSAAAFDLAGLFHQAGVASRAEIRIADGPALQVALHAAGPPADVERVRAVLLGAVDRLRALVHRMTLDDAAADITVTLGVALPAVGPAGLARVELLPGESAPPGSDETQRALGELRGELEATNRGVVALYSELDDQSERVRQAEDRLRVLLDSVQDYAICMLAEDGTVESWNAGAERLFGHAADEITGRSFAAFYTAGDRDLDLPAEHLALARASGRYACEGLRVRAGGSAFDAHALLAVVRGAGGEPRGFSLVVRDVTERRRLEDDLRRRAEDLGAANRAKEEFLATLSHELRTPLNAMLGWTRLLRMGKLDAAATARALETIERNARVQEQLIADILDISRIVTGKLRLDLRPIDLEPIVDAAIDAVRPTVEAKGLTLTREVQAVGAVLGDPDRLQQVLWNLLANAIKFTPAGGRVHLAVARERPSAVITVTDSGEGMAPDLLPFVFDRFMQGDGSVTRLYGGLGLGLSIVRHIVELHGGQVRASSEGAGRGSRFSVHLPLRASQDASATAVVRTPAPLRGAS